MYGVLYCTSLRTNREEYCVSETRIPSSSQQIRPDRIVNLLHYGCVGGAPLPLKPIIGVYAATARFFQLKACVVETVDGDSGLS